MYCHNVRVVGGEHGVEALEQVGLPAEHRGTLGERAGRGHHRLLEVPGQMAAVIGAAPLRPMAIGQATVDAEGGVQSADRLAGLRWVDP
ncbi:hypothetical protein SDC9_179678 [bioreactor metagenome]|uniref:Uncharacterized protein n=1 Tax=bioreactor metagenome TaxID=1076179 RepID=A0A645H1I8_9ZZZZ